MKSKHLYHVHNAAGLLLQTLSDTMLTELKRHKGLLRRFHFELFSFMLCVFINLTVEDKDSLLVNV